MCKEDDLQEPKNQQLNLTGVNTGICQHCGEQEGDYRINPFIQDINGREEWEYICNDCYRDLIFDI